MKSYLVTYELNEHYLRYDTFHAKIESLGIGGWVHCTKSMHIIKTNLDARDIRAILEQHLYGNDKIFVARIGQENAAAGLDIVAGKWLQNYL